MKNRYFLIASLGMSSWAFSTGHYGMIPFFIFAFIAAHAVSQETVVWVFIRTQEPAALDPTGWRSWNVKPALYAEYQCYGPGSDTSRQNTISRQLSDEEAQAYTISNIFSRKSFVNNSGWFYIKII
ncbi:hypothetical protein GF407_10970 [candidate division KSB1 bacterium]|nr:hypothetical protein [candidate division KSB1 bacterium]